MHTLKSTVDYFNNNGSMTFVAFLDCSKAFDRVSHYGIFSKLIQRKVPLCILMCLVFWYLNMTCIVKWGSGFSKSFPVPLGVKQGGVNSPDLFNCYINDLVNLLKSAKVGCHLYKTFLAIILFADDICLLAPTRSALQRLVTLCTNFFRELGLEFNSKKCKVVVFHKRHLDTSIYQPIYINSSKIDYVDTTTYLGMKIVSNRGFTFSAEDDLMSFYRAFNAILSTRGKPSDEILMQLMYTNCVSILTYGNGVKEFSSRQMTDCNTAVNNAIRRIFTFHRWESTRSLREGLGYKSLTELFAEAKANFLSSLSHHRNPILRTLSFITTVVE